MKDKKWKIPEQRQLNPGDSGYDATKDPDSPEFGWDPVLEAMSGIARTPEGNPIDAWTDRAVRRIVLPNERKKCRAELIDHMIDRHIEGLNHGLSPQEAARKAVDAMGDPDETGALLRKIHQPWASWILCLTRVLLVLVLGWALISGAFFRGDSYGSDTKETVLKRRVGSTGELGSFGCFDVSVARAEQLWLRSGHDENNELTSSGDRMETRITLRFSSAPWYQPGQEVLARSIWIRDDQGRVYSEYMSAISDPEARAQWSNDLRSFYVITGDPNPFGQNDVTVKIFRRIENSEWLELFYNWNGTERSTKIWFQPWEEGDVKKLSPEEMEEAARSMAEPEQIWSEDGPIRNTEILSTRELAVRVNPEHGSVCIPWARQIRCVLPAELTGGTPEPRCYMQCVVVRQGIQDAASCQNREIYGLQYGVGSESLHNIHWMQACEEFREDAVFWLIQWECRDETESYDLFVNGSERIILTPGEEIAE